MPKHSLPPQEQILCYMGRFTNCPYGTPEKPRSIFLKIFSYENKYSILIKNTVAKSVLQNNPRFITDKANRYLHGIGMKSIEHTVDKNGGYIQRYEEDGMFCVHILL